MVKFDKNNEGRGMSQAAQNITKIQNWLSQDVYPLWSGIGVDRERGGFIENLSFDGAVIPMPRRAMVQSRQIYSFLTGARMRAFPVEPSHQLVVDGVQSMVKKYSLPSGGFRYSVNEDGSPKSDMPDLYTQAFALFGLAQGYTVSHDEALRARAKSLLQYLRRERAVPHGGFTEVDDKGLISYKSNPHMHLFEAVIAWMQIDPDAEWRELGDELLDLCLQKFIDPQTGVLAEYFDETWGRLLENGRYVFEPGHQYEWAWLLSWYEELTQKDLKKVRHQLFLLAEKHGVSSQRKIAYDEVWSDFTPKKMTSRFWPQGERIKAAARLGTEVSEEKQPVYAKAADEALETLFKFLETPKKGMWYDQLSETDTFSGDFSKSSSLYHIINAMEEYVRYRPQLAGYK